ncbi:FecR family protein [Microbacterium sp. ARD31]|uniref:FecR family protein n=1 Tax=Microbacterium sp. ARD31 TaxID=2962576 RepID=UPI002880EE61|nr:FecR family protein [Microbacterium sp. ARD31]MDT0182656.1 FecR family protein [Microbacterium sp. ARD31]
MGVLAGLVAVSVLAGCAGGPSADIDPLVSAVMLASQDSEARDVTERTTASEGDVVSTDRSGLAEVIFPDTSFMRVGPSSEVSITELGSAEVQRTTIELDVGETWHSVRELVAEDAVYEVVTPVGVASVRGTVFSVICTPGPECVFIVYEGMVRVMTTDGREFELDAYRRIVLPDGEPAVMPADALPDWVMENIERDGEREGATPLPPPPAEAASASGEWDVTITTIESNTSDYPVGGVDEVVWTLEQSGCEPECTLSVASANGWEETAHFEGTEIVFGRTGTFECVYDDGSPTGETGTIELVYRFQPDETNAGEATRMSGMLSIVETLDPPYTKCDMRTSDGSNVVEAERILTLVRHP